ncbi:unnamed protein product [Cylindrotheca closterium]|uniref:Uncharacterized protein n=1 Tax=Cylindrotheca closterium TaxID=2856 RepID=A0AAD2CNX6_9STRA|nr:unnamed protein product [Cylindrotheca closterium]
MDDYNTTEQRRGSMFGGARRGSFFGGWAVDDGEKSPEATAHRRASLQDRYRGMEHATQRRGSLFVNHHHHHSSENHPTEKQGRRSSFFGNLHHHETSEEEKVDDGHHHRRSSISFFSHHNHNRRGSVGPMATLSSVTAKSRRGSMGFFSGLNKIHAIEQPNNEDLAYQVMAAFADFDV